MTLFTIVGGAFSQQALPYEYGFENNNLATDGWIANITSSNSGIRTNSARTGSYGFTFNYSESSGSLISPVLTGGTKGVDVSFWYKEYSSSYGDEKFQVGYTTNADETDPANFTYGDVVTASTSWQQYVNTFPAGTKRIAIKYIYTNAFYLFLDDFSFEAYTTCVKPTGFAVNSVAYNSAVLSWTSDADAWDIDVNGDLISNITTKPYTLTGLTEATDYTVKVRANCGGGDVSNWTDVIEFSTPEQFPRPTKFGVSTVSLTTADIGWTSNGDATGSTLEYGVATVVNNEYKYDDGTFSTGVYASGSAFSYAIRLPAGSYSGNILKKVSVYDNQASTETITIYNDDAAEPTTQIASKPLVLTGSNNFVEVNFDNLLIDGTKNVWVVVSNESGVYVGAAVDNLGDANGRWTNLGGWGDLAELGLPGKVWMIHAEIASGNPATVESWNTVSDVTSPHQLTGLAEGTTYAVRVKSNYAGGSSAWVVSGFTTLSSNPVPTDVVATAEHTTANISWEGESDSYKVKYREAAKPNPTPLFFDDFESGLGLWTIVTAGEGPGWVIDDETGSNAATAYSYDSSTHSSYDANNWLISPAVQLGGVLMFKASNYSSYPDSYEVLLSTTGTDVADFTTTLKSMSTATGEISIDLSAYSGTGYIAIHHVSEDMYSLAIDDFGVYSVIPAGEWQQVATTAKSVELTGLEMDTKYDYTIIGVKGGSENAGTDIANFTTLSAKDKLFKATGDWNVAANWVPTGVPTNEDNALLYAAVTIPSGVVATAKTVAMKDAAASVTIKNGGQLKTSSSIEVTMEKDIAGYGDGDGKFSFISSPYNSSLASADVDGLLEGDYDYYRFTRSMNLEWRSYQLTSFNLTAGNGFLYANKVDKTLKFTGTTYASMDNYLTMTANYSASYPLSMILAGNPFTCNGTIYFVNGSDAMTGTIYKLNAAGDGFDKYQGYASVAPGEAVLVEYSENGTIYYRSEDYGNGTSLGVADNIVLPKHEVMGTNPDAGPVIKLANAADNSELLTTYDGKSVIAKLTGRTLYKDGAWNTLCLPFDLAIAGSPLEGATVKVLSATGTEFDENQLSVEFGDAPTTIPAGTPFIVKWASGDNIVEPVFTYKTINKTAGSTDFTGGSFVGNYAPVVLAENDYTKLYLGAANKLYWPASDVTLNSFRAYFNLPGATAAPAFKLDFGDEVVTGISNVKSAKTEGNDSWYTVDGRKLDKQPTMKGVYVNNGRKVVVK